MRGHRPKLARILVVAVAAVGGVVAALACTPFGADTADVADGGDGGGADVRGDTSPRDARVPREVAICAAGAFCDGFDDEGGLPRRWTKQVIDPPATLFLYRDGGLGPSTGLAAVAVPDGGVQQAYLQLDHGRAPASYEAVLAFSARVTGGRGFLLSPRFITTTAGAERRDVIVDFVDGAVRLGQNPDFNVCSGCVRPVPAEMMPIDTGWHRYIFVVSAHPTVGADDYGEVSLQVDGTVAIAGKLPFSLSSPITSGVQVGLTYGSNGAGGVLVFDDVSFTLTPLE